MFNVYLGIVTNSIDEFLHDETLAEFEEIQRVISKSLSEINTINGLGFNGKAMIENLNDTATDDHDNADDLEVKILFEANETILEMNEN